MIVLLSWLARSLSPPIACRTSPSLSVSTPPRWLPTGSIMISPTFPIVAGEVAHPLDVVGEFDSAGDERDAVEVSPAAWSRGTVSTSIESSDDT